MRKHFTETHTFAELDLSAAAYDEIAAKLKAAGYDHAFLEDGAIDLRGLGAVRGAPPEEGTLRTDAVSRGTYDCVKGELDDACKTIELIRLDADRMRALEASTRIFECSPPTGPKGELGAKFKGNWGQCTVYGSNITALADRCLAHVKSKA